MKENIKNQNGITLISIVVTIIILLILAGISISTLSGDNGILNQATTAKQETEEASIKETIKLSYITAKMLGGNISKNMKEGLEETYGTGKVNVITPDNENYQIEIDKIGTYTLQENGEIQVGTYQAQNVPEGWVTTNTANDENAWYAYKDR